LTDIIEGTSRKQKIILQHSLASLDGIRGQQDAHSAMITETLELMTEVKLRDDDETTIDRLRKAVSAMKEANEQEAKERKTAIEDLREQLQKSEHAREQAFSRLSSDYVFDIKILTSEELSPDSVQTQVTLDSGCNDNWVHASLVEAANAIASVMDVQDPAIYDTFAGDRFNPEGFVKLTWCMAEAAQPVRHVTNFMVHSRLPFKVVLGKEIIQENYELVRKTALGLVRQSVITNGKLFPLALSFTTLIYVAF
jgi:hypothetical protein